MNLSKSERLILINQFLILEKFNPDEEKMYALNRKILENGFVQNYNELFEWIPDDVPVAITQEVWDILKMYHSLNLSFHALEDHGDLKKENVKFRGFDGQLETIYMSYAKFVLHDLDKYDLIRDIAKYPIYQTDRPMLEKYRRMLAVWKGISGKGNHELTLAEIRDVIGA